MLNGVLNSMVSLEFWPKSWERKSAALCMHSNNIKRFVAHHPHLDTVSTISSDQNRTYSTVESTDARSTIRLSFATQINIIVRNVLVSVKLFELYGCGIRRNGWCRLQNAFSAICRTHTALRYSSMMACTTYCMWHVEVVSCSSSRIDFAARGLLPMTPIAVWKVVNHGCLSG